MAPRPAPAATADGVIAANIRRLRTERGLTQRAVGEALAVHTGSVWSAPVLSKCESPKAPRRFTSDDLYMFAEVLRATIADLLTPASDVQLPIGRRTQQEAAHLVGGVATGTKRSEVTKARNTQEREFVAMSDLIDDLVERRESLRDAMTTSDRLLADLSGAQR